MAKIVALFTLLVALTIIERGTALECYKCDTECEVSKASKGGCGGNALGPGHEAFCTTQVSKDKETATAKIRKCMLVNKGEEPPCPPGDKCTKCKTDLCNMAPLTGANMALAVAAIFLAKLFV